QARMPIGADHLVRHRCRIASAPMPVLVRHQCRPYIRKKKNYLKKNQLKNRALILFFLRRVKIKTNLLPLSLLIRCKILPPIPRGPPPPYGKTYTTTASMGVTTTTSIPVCADAAASSMMIRMAADSHDGSQGNKTGPQRRRPRPRSVR